jgi:hypothetical protein
MIISILGLSLSVFILSFETASIPEPIPSVAFGLTLISLAEFAKTRWKKIRIN